MTFIRGEGRMQGTLFPTTLDDLIPKDHFCRVLDLFVDRLDMEAAGFVRAEPAETGRPGYDPRDLLKLLSYGYFQQLRSSRRLEADSRRNVEVMWLLHRLYPDHKSIAEFRRLNGEAIARTTGELVKLAGSVGLVKGEWVVIDGSKFAAASSQDSVRERDAVMRYLQELEKNDGKEEPEINPAAVAAALEKLGQHAEPEAALMKTRQGFQPAYNVQTAVDTASGLIVAQQVTTDKNDSQCLLPMAQAAQAAVAHPEQTMHVVADAGYGSGAQAAACERAGIVTHVPALPVMNHGNPGYFERTRFAYQEQSDTYICPAGHTLRRQYQNHRSVIYEAKRKQCSVCPLKSQCTAAPRRIIRRHLHQAALERMQQRVTPQLMRLRRCHAEHPFSFLKYRIFGHPRFLLRGLKGAATEIAVATLVYNLKRMLTVMGSARLAAALA
jgi:transposase